MWFAIGYTKGTGRGVRCNLQKEICSKGGKKEKKKVLFQTFISKNATKMNFCRLLPRWPTVFCYFSKSTELYNEFCWEFTIPLMYLFR